MSQPRRRMQVLILSIVFISLIIFPLAQSLVISPHSAYAQDPISFTPSVAPFEVTSEPTLEPMFVRELGQLYGPSTGPPPNFIEIDGDEQFGYGYLTDNPDVFIIWVTDRNGTHYYTVDKNSEALRGTIDPLTNERDNNGFISYIDERNKLSNEIEQLENQYQNERRSEFGLVIGSAVSVSGGILLCGIGIAIAAGTGALLAPVSITLCAAGGTAIIGGSVLFFSKAIPAMSDTVETRDNIQDLRDDINENDEDMLHLFQTTYSFP